MLSRWGLRWSASVRGRVSAAVVLLAAAALVLVPASPAVAGPPPVMRGYVPMAADHMQRAMESVNSAAGPTLDFTVGLTNAASGSVMYYDHWEDGYEADIANPVQATTLQFGDGDTGNGDASLYCTACAGDLLPQGGALVMRNDVATPRDSGVVLFDGGDKVASTRGFAITAGGFTTDLGSLLAGVVSSYDTSKYATSYTSPIGQDTPVPPGTSNAFGYSGLLVQAAQDGTTVEVDLDGDGTVDVTRAIDEGESTLVDGGVLEGARVRASAPVQVHLATGDTTASYESRWYTLFPDAVLSADYMSMAGSSVDNFRTVNYLYNPTDAPLTITPTCASCSGTITAPARASVAFASPLGEAVRFASAGAVPFIAIAGVGSQSGAAPGPAGDSSSSWDWGFTMIPTSQLTTQVVLGWAPGNSNNPPANPVGDRNDDPVWVTTLDATTVRVDFDGDPSTGAIASPDCFGARHDQDLVVPALASTRIFDADDGDMTGARIYTCDGTQVAGAWGQDPENSPTGSPGFDAGYTIIPTTTMIVDKTAALATDSNGDGRFGPGDVMTYDIAIADAGSLAFTSVTAEDVLEPGVTYVPDSTEFDDGSSVTPIADDVSPPAATVFPLDESGVSLPDVNAGQTVHLRFDVVIDDPSPLLSSEVGNRACVDAAETSACDAVVTQLVEADLELTKTETASPTFVGDDATFEVTVVNNGPDGVTDVRVADAVPAGTTFVSADATRGTYDEAAGVWTVGALASGESVTLTMVATMDDLEAENFAQIVAAQAVDPDSQPGENPFGPSDPADQDDEDSVAVTVAPLADLELDKLLTAGPAGAGATEFEIIVTNDGPSSATGVAVTDRPPVDATFVSADPSAGTFDGPSGVWTIGDLAAGDSATVTVVYDLDSYPTENFAEVTASDVADPDSSPAENALDPANPPDEDDEATAAVAQPEADLALSKSVTDPPAFAGDLVEFEIAVGNDGPVDATGVEVTDLLPSGLEHDSHAPSQGAYDPDTGVWSVGTVAAGDSATLSVVARLTATTEVTNVAQVTASDQPDPDSTPANNDPGEDDHDSATVSADAGSIGDRVWDDLDADGTLGPGENGLEGVTVTLTLDGDGDGTFETDVDTQTTNADGDYLFTGLLPGDYRVTVDESTLAAGYVPTSPGGPIDVTVAGGDTFEDADFGYRLEADLDLTKVETDAPKLVGDLARFVVTVTNRGPAAATATVTDLLPDGFALQSATPSEGVYDATTGTWTGLDLAEGEVATLVVVARVDSADPLTNVAEIAASDRPDPDSSPANGEPAEDDRAAVIVDVDPKPAPAVASLTGRLWVDSDGDRTFDAGEQVLAGVTVSLLDSNGVVAARTVTDPNGVYRFENVAPGVYRVVIDASTLPGGLAGTVDPDAVLDGQHVVTLVAGENVAGVDFAYQPAPAGSPLPVTGAQILLLVALGALLLSGGALTRQALAQGRL